MPRMTDTPFDCAMALGRQELARQLVEANAEIERLRDALTRIQALQHSLESSSYKWGAAHQIATNSLTTQQERKIP